MDTDQWPQEMGLLMKSHMEGAVMPSAAAACSSRAQLVVDRRPRPPKEHALNCPRCQSTNTKFCYYNNYSLSQPRYFCKTCRRYWTEGGSLRNVPVGGGSRKNKRSSSTSSAPASVVPSLSSSAAAAKTKKLPDLAPPGPVSSAPTTTVPNPKFHGGHDLNQLAFSRSHLNGEFGEFRTTENAHGTASPVAFGTAGLSAIELLRGGISARGALVSPFMPVIMPTQEASADYPAGFGVQELIRSGTLGFPPEGVGADGRYSVDVHGAPDDGRRSFFPGEDLTQVPSADIDVEHARAQYGGGDPCVFWNGEMGGGVGGSW